MKLDYFYGTITICPRNGYNETLEFSATKETSELKIKYPYGDINPEQANAISQFVKTVTDAYNVLQSQIDRVNKKLKLEQYAPVLNPEETSPNTLPESAVPQSCALGDEEVSTGADEDIDNLASLVEEIETGDV